MNTCVKDKKFLFFKWKKVEHDYKLWKITKFMSCSRTFVVTYRCKNCERVKEISFVKYDELLLSGISSEILNDITPLNSLIID